MKPSYRLTWIYIWGVPLKAWDVEHFVTMVSGCGELIELDEVTEDRSRVDVAGVSSHDGETKHSLIGDSHSGRNTTPIGNEGGDVVRMGKKVEFGGSREIPAIVVHYSPGGIGRRAKHLRPRRRIDQPPLLQHCWRILHPLVHARPGGEPSTTEGQCYQPLAHG